MSSWGCAVCRAASAAEPKAEEGEKPKKKRAKKKDDAPKPKRVSLPKGMDANLIDLTAAMKLLELPRDIGKHPKAAI